MDKKQKQFLVETYGFLSISKIAGFLRISESDVHEKFAEYAAELALPIPAQPVPIPPAAVPSTSRRSSLRAPLRPHVPMPQERRDLFRCKIMQYREALTVGQLQQALLIWEYDSRSGLRYCKVMVAFHSKPYVANQQPRCHN